MMLGEVAAMAYLKLAAALIFAAGLMIYPAECAAAVREAMANWAESVAPALFPFAAVMPFLTCAEARRAYDRLFGYVVRKLFRLPGTAASAIVVGLACGSPGGAMAVARVARGEGLTKGQATRLAGIACGVSPVFALSVMGVAIYGSAAAGWRLVIAQLVSQLAVGVIFRNLYNNDEPVARHAGGEEKGAIMGAVLAVLRVCGYMAAFSVAITLAEKLIGPYIWGIAAFIDLPTGAVKCTNDTVAAGALGFAGLCIAFQNMAVLEDMVKPLVYMIQKAVGAVICAGVYAAMNMRGYEGVLRAFVRHGRIYEVNLLILSAILIPCLAIFLWKKPKKHFS
ncbi:MAG: hypothetical protein IJC56_01575 [Clostridia bacterium]|nr:hypothetical protein [Clostridia bacterium]